MIKDLIIYIVTHKEKLEYSNAIYEQIQVGKALNPDLDLQILSDNTDSNISHKNKNYCELTALYHIWKNSLDKSRYIGLVHYRRFFYLKDKASFYFISEKDNTFLNSDAYTDEKNVLNILKHSDIIMGCPITLPTSVRDNYYLNHIKEDLDIIENIICRDYPQYKDSWVKIMEGNKYSAYNMFITSSELLNEYCEWLFGLFEKAEKEIHISKYNYQERVFGFLSERLLNVWVDYKKLKVKYLPIVSINIEKDKISPHSQFLRRVRANFLYRLNNLGK